MCSDEIKGQAMAALLAGQGISEVARKYNIGKATVHRLKEKLKADGGVPSATTDVPISPEVGERLASMDQVVSLALCDMIRSIATIAKTVSDEEYIKKQSAAEVAVLLGTISDKAFRILEAYENARESAPGAAAAPGPDPGPDPEVVPA